MQDLPYHEAANLFPMMDPDSFRNFVEDIRQHGLCDPIQLLDGRILDGRNRYQACRQLGIEGKTIDVHTDNPVAYVCSRNLHRRHLTASQRAIAAGRAVEFYEKRARERMQATQFKPASPASKGTEQQNIAESTGSAKLRSPSESEELRASDEAGRVFGISGRMVDYGKKVVRQGIPELVRAVEEGRIAVSVAAEWADQPVEQQQAAVARLTCQAPAQVPVATEPPAATPASSLLRSQPLGTCLFKGAHRAVRAAVEALKTYSQSEEGRFFTNADWALETFRGTLTDLETSELRYVCPDCRGWGCDACHGLGRLTGGQWYDRQIPALPPA